MVLSRENPSDMGIEETALARRMHVGFCIGKEVMMTMFGRPPQDVALHRALREASQDELERPARREGPMREIAVITGTDRKDADDIEAQANPQRRRAHAGPDRGEGGEVKKHKGDGRGIENVVMKLSSVCLLRHEWPCVFPSIATDNPASGEAKDRLAQTAMDSNVDSSN
jgi:hypothetical protein